jgi:hypothetical protein
VANYWGSSDGPQASDGSTVEVPLNEPDSAAIYDPYLTSPTDSVATNETGHDPAIDQLEFGVGIQDFGQTIRLSSSGQTFASPAQSVDTLEDSFADAPAIESNDPSQNGFKIFEFNNTAQQFELVDADNETAQYQAYVATFESGDDNATLNLEYDQDTPTTSGEIDYEQGYTLVPSATANSSLSDPTDATTFGLNSGANAELSFTSTAEGTIYATEQFAGDEASDIDKQAPAVSPYAGVFVYHNQSTSNEVTGSVDSSVTLEQIVDEVGGSSSLVHPDDQS